MRGSETVDGQPIKVYDDGKSGDHYTVVYVNREPWGFTPEYIARTGRDFWPMLGMSAEPFHPQGIVQHCEGMIGPHLGKRIPFASLPADCQQAVHNDLAAEVSP